MIKHLKAIFLGSCLILIAFNSVLLVRSLVPDRPVGFSGLKFAGLHDILKNETHIGYWTDLDLKDDRNLAEYEQAQFMLAPAILDINSTSTRFFIVNCSSDEAAAQRLMLIGAEPLKRNQFGVILARNPEVQP
jgi:hypothetical protein